MKSKRKKNRFLHIVLTINLLMIGCIFLYKSYLSIIERDYKGLNEKNKEQIMSANNEDGLSFVVLGNIKNSIHIFDRNMAENINEDDDVEFVISTGNAVRDGEEDKYKILHRSLEKLDVPTIVGVGDNEVSTETGLSNYYTQYGSPFDSFYVDNSYFIFLDTTGMTSFVSQKNNLIEVLNKAEDYEHIFIFMNRPPFKVSDHTILHREDKYIKSKEERQFYTTVFSEYNVDAVFSSGSVKYLEQTIDGVDYYVSGGAGGELILNDDSSFYHYMKITVDEHDQIDIHYVKQDIPSNHFLFRILQNVWVYIHSLFYTSAITIILVLSSLISVAIIFYNFITREVNYYREFDDLEDEEINRDKKLNIAMFTNNYFPFIGGVPISIRRLAEGLMKNGHNVFIFAPDYPGKDDGDEEHVIRCKLLLYYKGSEFNFAIANIFKSKIEKEFLDYHFDVIHVHHPFWMGRKGLKLGKNHNLPVILTYHTRLEKYAHYLPFFQITFQNLFSHFMIKRFSQQCDAIIAPTTSAKEYLVNIGVSREKFVLPTGICLDAYKSVSEEAINKIKATYKPNNEILLCSVSRLSKEKNIYFLLEGIEYVKNHTSVPFKFVLIGDGPEKQNLLKIIKERGLEDIVTLTGSIPPDEVVKFYLASDVFVFSSQSETQGMVILEAMAGGCPVVAVRSSGIDDVIINGSNGYKTKPEIHEWANKLSFILENPEQLKSMSKQAIDFAEQYGIEEMAKHVEDIYYKKVQQHKMYYKLDQSDN